MAHLLELGRTSVEMRERISALSTYETFNETSNAMFHSTKVIYLNNAYLKFLRIH